MPKDRVVTYLRLLPRLLAFAMIIFVSTFSLYVFDGVAPWYYSLAAYILKLFPAYLVLTLMLISWRRELIGGILFILCGLAHGAIGIGDFFSLRSLIISIPLIVIGLLFLFNWFRWKMGIR